MFRFPIVPAKPATTVEFFELLSSKIGVSLLPGTTPPCQFPVVSQLVSAPSPIQVKFAGAMNLHPVLLPEFTLLVPTALMRVLLILYESWTSKKLMVRVPCGSICHCVPGTSERSESNCPEAPCSVRVPITVWVLLAPEGKVSVAALATVLVRLLNVVAPLSI